MDRPILKYGDAGSLVMDLKAILAANGYTPSPGDVLDSATIAQIEVFQLQHLGPSGAFLECNGEIGPETWWSLDNPSGAAQRSGIKAPLDYELTPVRTKFLRWLATEHAIPVVEKPDGSNRHPRIDHYFKPTGLIGLAWCCALQSCGMRETLGRDPLGEYFVGCQKLLAKARELGMVVQEPKPGDLGVIVKSMGQGHIFAINGVSEDGNTIGTYGGNEGNRLKSGRRARVPEIIFVDPWQDGQQLDFTRMPNAGATIGANEATR